MAGCFGNHPEDRARARELNRYLDAMDANGAIIDQRAEDIYLNKLETLADVYRTNTFGTPLLNLDDVLGDIFYGKHTEGYALALAISKNNEQEAGRAIIKLVTRRLRELADYEAENECD